MEEKNLIFVALLCCLIGTLIILFLSERLETPLYASSEINSSLEGRKVFIQGYLEEVREYEKLTRFKIKDTSGSITAVVFEKNLHLKENSFIQVKGEVTVFNNQTELNAKEIYIS